MPSRKPSKKARRTAMQKAKIVSKHKKSAPSFNVNIDPTSASFSASGIIAVLVCGVIVVVFLLTRFN